MQHRLHVIVHDSVSSRRAETTSFAVGLCASADITWHADSKMHVAAALLQSSCHVSSNAWVQGLGLNPKHSACETSCL